MTHSQENTNIKVSLSKRDFDLILSSLGREFLNFCREYTKEQLEELEGVMQRLEVQAKPILYRPSVISSVILMQRIEAGEL